MAEAISLQWNCGFARVAIKELSQCKRGQLRNFNSETEQEFKSHFGLPTFHLPDNLFQANTNGRTPFNHGAHRCLTLFPNHEIKLQNELSTLRHSHCKHGKPYHTANKVSIHSLHAVLAT